jgi:hypothetical protein
MTKSQREGLLFFLLGLTFFIAYLIAPDRTSAWLTLALVLINLLLGWIKFTKD